MTDEKKIAQQWDANAPSWVEHVRAGHDLYRDLMNNPAFFAFVGDVSGLRVLDAGCGEGYNTRLFADRGAHMTGVDISQTMIAAAREEEEKNPLGIRYEVRSMGDLSCFDASTFDAVLSTMALMDAPDYEAALHDFHRLLKPDGLLAFSVTHPCFTYEILGLETDASGEVVGIRLGDYFRGGSVEERWSFSAAQESHETSEEQTEPFCITYFQRTLSGYLNPLASAGFALDAVHEPRPDEEACRKFPALRKHRCVPHSLFIKARRASE